ncbi:MAG TPA: hypothetical protein VMT16_08805 [Thermoanaerobaculia bacterium]|nr:hypothetical protein [Thermoanaerobaculia bacterium]
MRSTRTRLIVAVVVAFLVPAAAVAAVEVGVGQVGARGAEINGDAVPAGTTLVSPSLVRTSGEAALVHFDNGTAVVVAPSSRAYIERAGGDLVRVAVLEGSVAYRDHRGEVVALLADETAVLGPERRLQDQEIGEGTPVAAEAAEALEHDDDGDGLIELCHLDLEAPTAAQIRACHEDPSGCDWDFLEVTPAAVPTHFAHGDVYAGDNDLGLDDDCEEEPVGLLLPHKLALGLAAAAGAFGIFEIIEDPGEEPVTPSGP